MFVTVGFSLQSATLVAETQLEGLAGFSSCGPQPRKHMFNSCLAHGLESLEHMGPSRFLLVENGIWKPLALEVVIEPKLSQWTGISMTIGYEDISSRKHSYIHNMQSLLFISIQYMSIHADNGRALPLTSTDACNLLCHLMPSFERRGRDQDFF